MSLNIEKNISLSNYTTLQVGGHAEYFISVGDETELVDAILYANENSLSVTVLGGGSNVLVSDSGVKGLVIHIGNKGIEKEVDGDDVFLTVAAGEVLDEVIEETVSVGLWGIENLSHIPGSIGAVPIQNVGAYGVEARDVIESVRVYNLETEEFEVLTNEACKFGYRDSLFKKVEGKKYIVVSVVFRLSTIPTPELAYRDLQERFSDTTPSLQEIRNAVIEIRKRKQCRRQKLRNP